MKTFLTTLISITCISLSVAQPGFTWAKKAGFEGLAITNDAAGNIYITGIFSGTIDFDPNAGIHNLTSVGVIDTFVMKINAAGNLIWAKSFTPLAGTSIRGSKIKVDGFGNVYTLGFFTYVDTGTPNIVDFDPGPANYNIESGRISPITGNFNQATYYISKLDNGGNFTWARRITNDGQLAVRIFDVDNSGQAFIGGYFDIPSDFNPDPILINNLTPTNRDGFILKLNDLGEFAWAKQYNSTGFSDITDLKVDALGNIYTTGIFEGVTDFNPGASVFNITSAGAIDASNAFVTKFDGGANFLWAKSFVPNATGSSVGRKIEVDAVGNVYTTGDLNGTVDFNPSALGVANLLAANGTSYISKLNTAGNYVWAKQLKTAGYAVNTQIDDTGNLYLSGIYALTIDFDPGPDINNITSNGSNDIYTLKLNSSGNFLWAVSVGGTLPEEINSFSIDAENNIYSVGEFNGTVDFNPGIGVFNLTVTPRFFLSKLNQNTTPLPITLLSFSATCNNNSVDLKWSTSAESNNKEFTIEKSIDGQFFNSIGTILAVENDFETKQYQFKDLNAANTSNYYRLKQTDFDGKSHYFKTLSTNCKDPKNDFKLLPNPIENGKFIIFLPNNSKVNVIDLLGRILISKEYKSGKHEINFQEKAGVYFIQVETENEISSKQFLIR
jgi:Secretion system C-terminal sorting domain